ncbi:23532_t:CDS:2 [Gigaspora margarita]|uniref:23532_t:CDS:1 n=1 Tax=Gigaspora margarita TaxID=4874 RepID=A0ABM8VY38_GIGMA|nr:23532_t:CDS:2 [Gigaspora margarita]
MLDPTTSNYNNNYQTVELPIHCLFLQTIESYTCRPSYKLSNSDPNPKHNKIDLGRVVLPCRNAMGQRNATEQTIVITEEALVNKAYQLVLQR